METKSIELRGGNGPENVENIFFLSKQPLTKETDAFKS